MVGELALQRGTLVGLCIFLWAASGRAALYFDLHGYSSWAANVLLFQKAVISRRNGWLQLNPYSNFTFGRALYKDRFQVQNTLNNSVASFNTSFMFSMNTDRSKDFYGDGLAFFICPRRFLNDSLPVSSGGYLGMFNSTNNGLMNNRIFAVEFDTHQNSPFHDPNDNHVGIDINSVTSIRTNDLSSLGMVLNDGRKIICWIDYDGGNRYIWVYLAYSPSAKPSSPIIEMGLDLSPYMRNTAYVGFTSATGQRAELHTIYYWWFLSGFGNLTLPISVSSQPREAFQRTSAVITVFTLSIVFGFLCVFCIIARQRWQEKSQHLIDVLLPVACWIYWKESMKQEVRMKLAKPTTELLAWLWRTRWLRARNQQGMKTRIQMLMCRNLGPQQREAWQQGLTHKQAARMSVFLDTQQQSVNELKQVSEKTVKGTKKKKKKPQHTVTKPAKPSLASLVAAKDQDLQSRAMHGQYSEPRLKNFRISNASFIMMDGGKQAKLVPVITSSGGQMQFKKPDILTPRLGHSGGFACPKHETTTENDPSSSLNEQRISLSERSTPDIKIFDLKVLGDGNDQATMAVIGGNAVPVEHQNSSGEPQGSGPHPSSSMEVGSGKPHLDQTVIPVSNGNSGTLRPSLPQASVAVDNLTSFGELVQSLCPSKSENIGSSEGHVTQRWVFD